MAGHEKMFIFGIFKACISNFVYYNIHQRKLKTVTQKKYALNFLIRPLHFSLEIHVDSIYLHGSPKKNLEALSKNEGHTFSA